MQRAYGAALDLFYKTLLEPLCRFIGFKHLVMQEHGETLVCSMLLLRLCYLYRKILLLGANSRKSRVVYYAVFWNFMIDSVGSLSKNHILGDL